MSMFEQIKAGVSDFFLRGSPLEGKPVTDDDWRRGYRLPKSITDHLPWIDIVDNDKILLEDGRSFAAAYELTSIPTEARSKEFLESQRNAIRDFIGKAFEEQTLSPWVVSLYTWRDDADFRRIPDRVLEYAIRVHAQRDAVPDQFTHHFVENILRPHIEDLAREGGLFTDPLTGNKPWGGARRRVYMVFYRRHKGASTRRRGMTREAELDNQCKRVQQMLMTSGIKGHRLRGEEIRNWLFRWLNPAPKLTGGDTEAWLKQNPYAATEEEKVATWDLANDVVTRDIRSDKKTKCWYFDGKPHTVLSIEQITQVPKIGQVSAERYVNEDETEGPNAQITCLVDELPAGATTCITYVVKPQSIIRKHLERLAKNSKGDTPEAEATREEVKHARAQIARGNKLYPFSMAILLKAQDDDEMEDKILATETILGANHLEVIDPDYDEVRLDRYLRFLPCAYDPSLEQVRLRERIIYAHHLANILPLYGRSVGTGNPGWLGFNRGGEGFMCDPISPLDRSKNGHLFLFGPTGAGKSASLVYLQMFLAAIHNPRFVVVEAGESFKLLTEYFKKAGKSVVDIVLRPGESPSIPPFKPALELVDADGRIIQDHSVVEDVLTGEAELENAEQDSMTEEKVNRDILGEMLIIARLMITGGETKEEERMTRSDVGLLKAAVLNAAVAARKAGKSDILTEDLLNELSALKIGKEPERAKRIDEMAEAMSLFVDGFAGELFNRPGEELPDADFIRIEMGALAGGSNTKDKLSVAYISLINQIIARAQRTQRDGRPTINLTDEAHVITTDKLLASYLVIVSKLLGRRMGLWLWQATQNMKDYPDDAEKMLAMFEWWMCLFIDQGELKHIEKFKQLTPDQRSMLLSTAKEPGKYTEGVIMSPKVQGLFRMVPPALCFALAQTEKEEKSYRAKVMRQNGVSELEAAKIIGEELAESRRNRAA